MKQIKSKKDDIAKQYNIQKAAISFAAFSAA